MIRKTCTFGSSLMAIRPDYIFHGVLVAVVLYYAIKITLFMIQAQIHSYKYHKGLKEAARKKSEYENSIEYKLINKYLSEK